MHASCIPTQLTLAPIAPIPFQGKEGRKCAFSLVELMLSLIIISLIAAAFAPVISKKLSTSSLTIGGASVSEITDECYQGDDGDPWHISESCELCTKTQCLICGDLTCDNGYYKDTKTCSCKQCPSGCTSCESSSKCTSCTTGGTSTTPGYILKNNKCEQCSSTNYYSNGLTCSGSCVASDGYYCDSNGNTQTCTSKFGSACSSCNASQCTGCASGYYLNSSNVCTSCGWGCANCYLSSGTLICNSCYNWYSLLDVANNKCVAVSRTGCSGYSGTSSSYVCTSCIGEYYLYNGTCYKCNLTGCQTCLDNQSSQKCSKCSGGYYLDNGSCKICSTKYGSQCTVCDSSNCLSCNQGYGLSDDTTGSSSCKANDNNFTCSDSNFMRIGDLCVTRKNMGDSIVLSIPETAQIAKANAGSDYCYSSISKCCWLGGGTIKTAGSCDSENGGYSGCYRTGCNWDAANAICANFNYGGKKWRLPSMSELSQWAYYSIGLGSNGLMLCDTSEGHSSAYCGNAGLCSGAYYGYCASYDIWTNVILDGLYAYDYQLTQGKLTGAHLNPRSDAKSVRCVTDMND